MASFRARFGAFKLYGEWKNKMLALSNPLLLELNVFFNGQLSLRRSGP
jgi:hypothetical protein